MWETVKHRKQRKGGMDQEQREKAGKEKRNYEKREKKRQEKEQQEEEQQEKEQQEKEQQEKEQQEKEQHEKDMHEKHEKQNETSLDWLQRELEALRQRHHALEQSIQMAKGNNQKFGEEIDKIREEARKAFEALQIIYTERVTGEAHEMTQEMRDQLRADEELFKELIQEEMQSLSDQVRE